MSDEFTDVADLRREYTKGGCAAVISATTRWKCSNAGLNRRVRQN